MLLAVIWGLGAACVNVGVFHPNELAVDIQETVRHHSQRGIPADEHLHTEAQDWLGTNAGSWLCNYGAAVKRGYSRDVTRKNKTCRKIQNNTTKTSNKPDSNLEKSNFLPKVTV